MKISHIILTFALITYCLAQEEEEMDECQQWFDQQLEKNCIAVDSTSCKFNVGDKKCLKTNPCEEGNGNAELCPKLIHPDFHKKKCVYKDDEDKCIEANKKCTDYGYANPDADDSSKIEIEGDTCEQLNPGDEGNRCFYYYDPYIYRYVCLPEFNKCEDAPIAPTSKCYNNIPQDLSKMCRVSNSACVERNRTCDLSIRNTDKDKCSYMAPSNPKAKCIYNSAYHNCEQVYTKCEDFGTGYYSCLNRIPWLEDKNDFNYFYKCFPKQNEGSTTSYECVEERRNCTEYDGDDEATCISLRASDPDKRCVFNGTKTSGKCYEEYKSCKIYNDKIGKIRENCEAIKLLEPNQKCIYIYENDTCLVVNNYTTCEEYKGTDRTVCESIISPTTNASCVFEKDSICKEREFVCSQATNEEDCVYFAKASVSGKKCEWNGSSCLEVYETCDNLVEDNITSITCSLTYLYNGRKCYSDLGRCRSIQMTSCGQAQSEKECKLIAKTAVTDPDKKVCDYISGSCIENYKYCSDYRGTNYIECQRIKPYDETGNNIDYTSKCQMINNKCQKETKTCNEAGNNPSLCAAISPKIKDNHIKYCAHTDGHRCRERYKYCENITNLDECEDNQPQNFYRTGKCIKKDDKCVTREDCYSHSYFDKEDLCESNYNCTWVSENICTKKKELTCSGIKFLSESEENMEVCSSIQVSNPNKVCVLKADKTGCEEVLKYVSTPYYNGTSNSNTGSRGENSSEFMTKGINLIIVMIALLL